MDAQVNSQQVDVKELGVSFKIPPGWTAEVDGDYMFLKHHTIAGLLVIFESRSQSITELIHLANGGIIEEGVQLNSLYDFKEIGKNTVDGHYEGIFLGTIVKVYATSKINGYGSGVSVLSVSERKDFNNGIKEEAQKIVASVVFNKMEDSEQTAYWKNRLIGRRLKYYNTQSDTDFRGNMTIGISDKEILELFNDSSFYYNENNQSSVYSETIRSNNNSSGSYRIVTLENATYLQLFHNGNTKEFTLTVNSKNNILLNGRRFLSSDIED